jgi:hypothetical protein
MAACRISEPAGRQGARVGGLAAGKPWSTPPPHAAGEFTRKARFVPAAVGVLFFIMATVAAHAQPPRVEARLTPDSVAIGDRFELEVTVDKDMMQVVDFPAMDGGMLTDQIEIAREWAVDTVANEGRRMTLRKRLELTTFEEGIHRIGRFPVLYIDKNIVDTLLSADSLVLQVGTFEIDTLTMTIRDVKPVMGAPFKVGEVSGYVLWVWLALLLIGLVSWLIVIRRHNLTLLGKPKPVDPPHVVAIKELESLSSQKLWQNNKHKLYYTRLTDILRQYMEGRWGVAAMEMTTDETVAALAQVEIPEDELAHLRGILRSADLVKFAKQTPAAEENETAWTRAYYFVEGTKPTEQEKPEEL